MLLLNKKKNFFFFKSKCNDSQNLPSLIYCCPPLNIDYTHPQPSIVHGLVIELDFLATPHHVKRDYECTSY